MSGELGSDATTARKLWREDALLRLCFETPTVREPSITRRTGYSNVHNVHTFTFCLSGLAFAPKRSLQMLHPAIV